MRKTASKLVLVILTAVITSGVAVAKELKRRVTFSKPVVVNNTVVKPGTYDAVFDDQTNQLSIVKDGKVVARSAASIEKREQRDSVSYITREEEGQTGRLVLVSVVLKDNSQAKIVNNAVSAR